MKRLTMMILLVALGSQAMAGTLPDRRRERHDAGSNAEWGEESETSALRGLPEGSQILRDLSYGEAERQRLDVYLPPRPQRAAVIFMVHGGAWRTGDKAIARVVDNKAAHWLPLGYILVSANYRLLPDADPLVQADDLRRALVFAQRHAVEWGGDPDAFVLMGHSAGAHLVSLINADPRIALDLGARPWSGAVLLDTAAMDIVATMQGRHYHFYDQAFGKDPLYWRAASPMQQLQASAPPMLAVCSTKRPDHPCSATHDFAARAKAIGVHVEVLEQPLSHADINGELGLPGPYTEQVDRFIGAVLGGPGG